MTDKSSPSDVALLRTVLARELETINEYEQFAEEAQEEKLRAFFQHLADEEKEHVAEAMALINERDAAQEKHWNQADIRTDHFVLGKQAPPPSPPAEPSPPPATGPAPSAESTDMGAKRPSARGRAFTVGSLKRKR